MKKKSFYLIGTLASISIFFLILKFIKDPASEANRANKIAAPIVKNFGFNLAVFSGPTSDGSSLMGTRSHRWALIKSDGVTEEIVYFPTTDELCWGTTRNGVNVDHGCVVAKSADE
jgi:hypothetical protein